LHLHRLVDDIREAPTMFSSAGETAAGKATVVPAKRSWGTTLKLHPVMGLFALFAGTAVAAEGDMRNGTNGCVFRGAPATFELQTGKSGKWIVAGKIRSRDTGEYDPIRIEQHDHGSLKVTRHPGGSAI
jgi:hypothetical protein